MTQLYLSAVPLIWVSGCRIADTLGVALGINHTSIRCRIDAWLFLHCGVDVTACHPLHYLLPERMTQIYELCTWWPLPSVHCLTFRGLHDTIYTRALLPCVFYFTVICMCILCQINIFLVLVLVLGLCYVRFELGC